MQGCDAVVCATGGGAVSPFDNRAKKVDNQGTKNLVDAAKSAGIRKFVLVSSLLTNAKEKGQSSNPNYIVLQLFGGVLEEKLQVRRRACWQHVMTAFDVGNVAEVLSGRVMILFACCASAWLQHAALLPQRLGDGRSGCCQLLHALHLQAAVRSVLHLIVTLHCNCKQHAGREVPARLRAGVDGGAPRRPLIRAPRIGG